VRSNSDIGYQGIVTKLQDKEDSGKVSDQELQEAKCRTDVVTYSIMAEAQHFHQHRVTDFRDYVQAYLNAQIEFHKMVCYILYLRLSFVYMLALFLCIIFSVY